MGRPYAADRGMLRGGELFTLSMLALLGIFIMISGNNFLVIYLGLELLTLSSYSLVALRRGQCHGHGSCHEVLRARRHGQRLLALRAFHALRRDGFPSILVRCSRLSIRARSVTRCWCSALFSWWRAWHSSLALCRSTCGFLTFYQGGAHGSDAADRRRTQARCICHRHPFCWSTVCCPWRSIGSRCWRCWPSAHCLSVTWPPLHRPTSSACWRIRPSRRWALFCWGLMSGVINGNVDAAAVESAYSSAMFYVVSYVSHHPGCLRRDFCCWRVRVSRAKKSQIWLALNQRSPLYAGVMAVCLFSMAGIPPLVGFYAKLSVFAGACGLRPRSAYRTGRFLPWSCPLIGRVLLPSCGEGDVF